jgi:predicted nucleic acid-binding protein
MVAYLDSSVLLEHILKGDQGIKQVLSCDTVVTSEITGIECRRVIHRYRMESSFDDEGFLEAIQRLDSVLSGTAVIRLSETVLKRSGQTFPVIVKTLDALHLSSAALFRELHPDESILVFSYDGSFNRCAKAMEFDAPFS